MPKKHVIILASLPVLLALSSGFGVWMLIQKKGVETELNSAQSSLANAQSEVAKLTAKISELEKSNSTNTITEALPNGKTISYPNTEGNRRVLWWQADPTNPMEASISLSNKLFQQTLASIDPSIIANLCGTSSSLKALQTNMIVGVLNTGNLRLVSPQNPDCVHRLASSENRDSASLKKAKKAVRQIEQDTNSFLKTVIIK